MVKFRSQYVPPILAAINWGVAGVLLLSGVRNISGLPIFNFGPLAWGYLPAGVISIGVFSAGVVSVGLLSVGIFSLGVVSIGVFNIGIFSIGIYAWTVYMGVKAAKRTRKKELI